MSKDTTGHYYVCFSVGRFNLLGGLNVKDGCNCLKAVIISDF